MFISDKHNNYHTISLPSMKARIVCPPSPLGLEVEWTKVPAGIPYRPTCSYLASSPLLSLSHVPPASLLLVPISACLHSNHILVYSTR